MKLDVVLTLKYGGYQNLAPWSVSTSLLFGLGSWFKGLVIVESCQKRTKFQKTLCQLEFRRHQKISLASKIFNYWLVLGNLEHFWHDSAASKTKNAGLKSWGVKTLIIDSICYELNFIPALIGTAQRTRAVAFITPIVAVCVIVATLVERNAATRGRIVSTPEYCGLRAVSLNKNLRSVLLNLLSQTKISKNTLKHVFAGFYSIILRFWVVLT